MDPKNLQQAVDNCIKITSPNVTSTLKFTVGTFEKYGNFNLNKVGECYKYGSDQVSQLSQLKDGTEPLKAYLINQAEIQNALMYKLNNDLGDLKLLGKDVADDYKVLAKDNIKHVRKSGIDVKSSQTKNTFS